MVRSNYTFEKRQKELAKKKKKEDKRLKKLAATGKDDQADQADQAPVRQRSHPMLMVKSDLGA